MYKSYLSMRNVQVMARSDTSTGNLTGNQNCTGGQHCGRGAFRAPVCLCHSARRCPVWAHCLRLHTCCGLLEDHQRVCSSSEQLWWGPQGCCHTKNVPALHIGLGSEAAPIMTPCSWIAHATGVASMGDLRASHAACRKIGRLERFFALSVAVFGAALSLTGTIQAVSKIATGAV